MKPVIRNTVLVIGLLCALLLMLALVVRSCLSPSGYSYCVMVAKESDFTGEWLKASRTVYHQTILTPQCEARDRQLDNGNGPRKGLVRWVECYAGPDCNEGGQY